MHIHKIPLKFPFNWELKLKFYLLPERPTPSIADGRKWKRCFKIDGRFIPVIVEGIEGVLVVKTLEIPREDMERVENLVIEIHGIKDTRKLYSFMENDPILRKIRDKLYGFGSAGLMSADIFEGVVKAIIQQQI